MNYIEKKSNANFFFYFLGLIFGLSFPDFDYFFENFIGHRSIFTHSILISLIFIFILRNEDNKKKFSYITGITMGVAIHLISDLNLPSKFTYVETIKLFSYDIGKASFYWISINILIGLLIVEKSDFFNQRVKIEILNLIILIIYIYLTSEIYIYLTIFYICLKIIVYLFYKKFSYLIIKK